MGEERVGRMTVWGVDVGELLWLGGVDGRDQVSVL